MEENKKDVELKETKVSKESKKQDPKKERRSLKETLKNIFVIYKGEFDKIVWPTRQDLIKETFTVIVTSLMVGAVIASMDYLLRYGYEMFVTYVGPLVG